MLKVFVAARTNHRNHIHEILDFSINFIQARVLAALRTAQHNLVAGAVFAEEHLARHVAALLAIVEDHGRAACAEEQVGHIENWS